jgi:diguanylate cyclase (GGDEF)-like protein
VSIRTKYLIVFPLAMIVPVVVTVALLLSLVDSMIGRIDRSWLDSYADVVDAETAERAQKLGVDAMKLASDPNVAALTASRDYAGLKALLAQTFAANPSLDDVAVVDADGRALAEKGTGLLALARLGLKELAGDRPGGAPATGFSDAVGGALAYGALPVKDASGKVVGYAAMAERLSKVVSAEADLVSSGRVIFFDLVGLLTPSARAQADSLEKSDKFVTARSAAFSTGGNQYVTLADGKSVLVHPLTDKGGKALVVATIVAGDRAAADARRAVTRATLYGGIVMVLLIVLVAAVISNRLVAPILRLSKDVQMLSDLMPVGAPIATTKDEVIRLTSHFNALVKVLKDNLMNLDVANAALTDLNTELMKLKQEAEERSIHDELTGLYNYRYFANRLQQEYERSARYARHLSLLMIDIDHFKHYNDTHGHEKANDVLKGIGEVIQACVRASDIAARYGGEEFVVIAPETSEDKAKILADRIRKRVEEHDFADAETQPLGRLTVSIGVAGFPETTTSAQELIEGADEAMYKAKADGRNRVVLHKSVHEP